MALRYSYPLKPPAVAVALRAVLGLPNVVAEDGDQIGRALTWQEQRLDFADALHLASSDRARRFLTLDKAFARQAKALETSDVSAL